jgi:hypothetical protein
MKTNHWTWTFLAVGLVALAGCKKENQAPGPPQKFYGVQVDWLKLDPTFANASPEVQNGVLIVKRNFRYGMFPQAVAELEKLAKNPALTEPQKKLVGDLIEQTKQVIAQAPAPPAR